MLLLKSIVQYEEQFFSPLLVEKEKNLNCKRKQLGPIFLSKNNQVSRIFFVLLN